MAVLGVILTQELPSENQRVGPGPLSRGESLCVLPRRPSSSLECGNLRIGPLPTFPSPEQQREGSPHPRLVLRLALQPRQGSATLLSRCCQMLGCKRLRGAPGHTPEAGPPSSQSAMAPARSWGWMWRGALWCICP